jgi:small subunit ribosomal protein S3Ae
VCSGDRFLKKEWWTIKSPGMFTNRDFTKSPVNVTQGKTYSYEQIKGRIFEISVGDLNPQSKTAFQKMRLVVDDTTDAENKVCLTNFAGLTTTKDHLCSLIRKWHSLIETHVDVKTTDGFLLRFFIVAFTKKVENQLKATAYAQRSQIMLIRKKMDEVVKKNVSKIQLKDLINKL